MTINTMELEADLLTAEEELELARRMEAGLYAEHLLDTGSVHARSALEEIRRRGRAAREEMWRKNLRLVMKLAREHAWRYALPVEDLFQDGCLGLGEALRRFDHARGRRFSTLAHKYVRHYLAASAAQRCGEIEGPLHRQRIRNRIRAVAEGPVEPSNLRDRAEQAGVSGEMAVLSHVQVVPIEHLPDAQALCDGHFEEVERIGTDFLNLLEERVATFLRLRFGIGCPALGVEDLSRVMRMSPSSVRRAEAQALAIARDLLLQEQCTLPPRSRRVNQLAA